MKFRHILKVCRQDWSRISRNPVALIILIGICFLPSLYAWVNIEACWNIYGNTNEIPVAVVNCDKGSSYQGKELNVGGQIIDQLKKNNKIKWVFTDETNADMGLIDSTYYAMIEIPSDFSAKFLTVLTDKPQKPQIIYKVDTKANPVAGKITTTASNTLIQQVKTEFVSTVNETIFSSVNKVGQSADENKEGVLQMKDSVIGLSRNMNSVTEALKSLGENSDNLGTLLKSTNAAMPMIQSSLAAAGKTNADNEKIAASVQTTVSQSAKNVSANLDYIQNSNQEVARLFRSLNESAAGANASAVNTVLPVINTQLDSTDSSIEATIAYLEKCRDCDYNADIEKVITQLQNTEKDLATLRQALVDLEQQIGSAHKAADDLYQYVRDHQQDINNAIDAADSAMQQAIPALRALAQNPVVPADIQSQLTTLADELEKIYNNGQTGAELKKDVQAFLDSQGKTDAAFDALEKALPEAVSAIDTATGDIDRTITFLKNLETTNNTVRRAQYDAVIADLQAIRPSLKDEKSQLSAVQSQLLSANSVAKSTADLVNADSARIASQIAVAVTTYNARVKPDLQTLSGSLSSSMKDASAMISQAQQMSTGIASMVKTAQEGADLTSDISGKLTKKLAEFGKVITSLGSQMEQVSNGDISEIISIMQNNPKLMGNYIADPFDISQEKIDSIPNYGSGMAPLYTCLALWVGCLILNSILKPEVAPFDGIENLTLREKYFGKMLLFLTLAVAQSLIVSIGDIAILKIYVVSAPLFIFFAVFASIVYSIITYTLMATLGNVGKALAIIYLILQVAGSGGSYPIQIDPPIFQFLQPLFPFTYTLSGMREAIAGPLVSAVVGDVVGLTIFGLLFLIGGYFTVKPLNDTFHQFELGFKKSGLGE